MATTKNKKAKAAQPEAPKHIGLVQNDGWLEPYEEAIREKYRFFSFGDACFFI